MRTITFFKRTTLFALILSGAFIFSQCDSGKNEKEGGSSQNKGDTAAYNEQEAMYPDEKLQENTNLKDKKPLEIGSQLNSIDQNILLATLNKQKTEMEYRIEQMQNDTVNPADAGTSQANVQKLKAYVGKLDMEITKVRGVTEGNFQEVADSAQEAIKEAGDLMTSNHIQIQRGF